MTSTTPAVTPWCRQAWPWFLISLPATAVVAGLITFYLAARGWDGPVANDYYKQGLAINEELTRSSRAAELGVTASVKLSGLAAGERVRVGWPCLRARTWERTVGPPCTSASGSRARSTRVSNGTRSPGRWCSRRRSGASMTDSARAGRANSRCVHARPNATGSRR
jgi:hypothetical protein